MNTKSFLVATILSLPLLPLLILDPGTLSNYATAKDVTLAAPFVIEMFVFYSVYKFLAGQSSFSSHEQKALLGLGVGLFSILAVPVILWQVIDPVKGVSSLALCILMLYALINIIKGVRNISSAKVKVNRLFLYRYAYPGLASLVIMAVLLSLQFAEINFAACFFIIRNFLDSSNFVH